VSKYIEMAIKITEEDYRKIDNKEINKMWSKDDKTMHLDIKCEVFAVGVEGFISDKLDK